MLLAGRVRSGNTVKISFDADREVVRCLKDLVKHYKMPIADVMAALICFEHQNLEKTDEPVNEFVQKPREMKW